MAALPAAAFLSIDVMSLERRCPAVAVAELCQRNRQLSDGPSYPCMKDMTLICMLRRRLSRHFASNSVHAAEERPAEAAMAQNPASIGMEFQDGTKLPRCWSNGFYDPVEKLI